MIVGDPRLPKRFWDKVKVEQRSVSVDTPCWIWKACLCKFGYGAYRVIGGTVTAYRIAYELLVGSVPQGLELDHVCRIPACCNPSHLEIVTHRENLLRGAGFAGVNSKKTHCPAGHELTPDNLRRSLVRKGWRQCRLCHNTNERNRQNRKKLAADIARAERKERRTRKRVMQRNP